MSAAPPNPGELTAGEYAAACVERGFKGGHAGALERYARLYRRGEIDAKTMHAPFGKIVRKHLSQSGEGEVVKFTQLVERGPGGAVGAAPVETESVLIPMIGKKGIRTHTLCVSSQVGCAMGCGFCQTAQMGLLRSLSVFEIVSQWFAARHELGCETLQNVVFMGMGEPMDNLEAVIGAIRVLTDHRGPAFSMHKITVSTVGRTDGIRRLAAQVREHGWHRLSLAVSLNAPNDEVRSRIMPINRAMPMRELREAIQEWPIYSAAKICFEYVLIPGVNSQQEHARELADYVLGRGEYAGCAPLPGLVNLIPYNPRDNSPWEAPTETAVDEFMGLLSAEGVYVKRRQTKGRDTMAACGQLGNPALRKRPMTGIQVSAGRT